MEINIRLPFDKARYCCRKSR